MGAASWLSLSCSQAIDQLQRRFADDVFDVFRDGAAAGRVVSQLARRNRPNQRGGVGVDQERQLPLGFGVVGRGDEAGEQRIEHWGGGLPARFVPVISHVPFPPYKLTRGECRRSTRDPT